MFETIEHIILPIAIALLTGGLVAGIMSQRTIAKTAYIDGLKKTIEVMQGEMDRMTERTNTIRVELSANAVTISDLRNQIASLQSRNFDLIDQLTKIKRENGDLQTQIRHMMDGRAGKASSGSS